ncbi:hypothetical protein SAMN05444483_10657 [Salegentibacter echinorum]|uniref:Uncharacterized protein n=1 Tax=Salegentibacter echinorum TaxID=1073325 RepID=A0A1M5HY76_SALEC|nr:hypothetical protein [Salegentibacter echinorum]SHG20934.1 hypothetical protein SAMN05444483_10657 [Salegentibacter echinorum]
MIKEIIEYKNILNDIEELIDNSPYKKSYIISEVGISTPTFYRKLKTNSFTPDEALKIIRLIKPKEAYAYDLEQGLKRSKDDIENGRTYTRSEILEGIKEKLK